ncbi:hypothetical protein IC232_30625 [Microvirga sp. BT688]|uniref:hypothetical protein n=1 Tax=Microvirga sp. TaxID=1873136 RepID=UPI0016838C01|nr:hypothetical protein [Microvirga sp.]MBD2750990.1 hypothetical protein [Microvirga sp.]
MPRLFYGHRPAAVAFQAGLLAIDIAAIGYFIATSFVDDEGMPLHRHPAREARLELRRDVEARAPAPVPAYAQAVRQELGLHHLQAGFSPL